jgi:hypothetical protein
MSQIPLILRSLFSKNTTEQKGYYVPLPAHRSKIFSFFQKEKSQKMMSQFVKLKHCSYICISDKKREVMEILIHGFPFFICANWKWAKGNQDSLLIAFCYFWNFQKNKTGFPF